MPHQERILDSYVIDTYKIVSSGKFVPGAITYAGRKKADVLYWKQHPCETNEEANTFVRQNLEKQGLREMGQDQDIKRDRVWSSGLTSRASFLY